MCSFTNVFFAFFFSLTVSISIPTTFNSSWSVTPISIFQNRQLVLIYHQEGEDVCLNNTDKNTPSHQSLKTRRVYGNLHTTSQGSLLLWFLLLHKTGLISYTSFLLWGEKPARLLTRCHSDPREFSAWRKTGFQNKLI